MEFTKIIKSTKTIKYELWNLYIIQNKKWVFWKKKKKDFKKNINEILQKIKKT